MSDCTNLFCKRTYNREGCEYTLVTGCPRADTEGTFWTTITLLDDTSEVVWSHTIAGIDEVQSILLAWQLANTLLMSQGGYTFLGTTDLCLTHG